MRVQLFDSLIMFLAVFCGIGSLALFARFPLGGLGMVRLDWPDAGLLCWDALLCLAFFLQHSGMVRQGFRSRISAVVPPRYHRAIYSIASGLVLAGLVVLWQPCGQHLLILHGALRWTASVFALAAVSLFAWGAFALRDLDLFGLSPIRAHRRGVREAATPFIVRGPYRWVRHPWYFGAIVLFWSSADLTTDRLLFNVLWTGWILVGTRLEESDLAREFGASYEEYRRRVPMLIPWRPPTAV